MTGEQNDMRLTINVEAVAAVSEPLPGAPPTVDPSVLFTNGKELRVSAELARDLAIAIQEAERIRYAR